MFGWMRTPSALVDPAVPTSICSERRSKGLKVVGKLRTAFSAFSISCQQPKCLRSDWQDHNKTITIANSPLMPDTSKQKTWRGSSSSGNTLEEPVARSLSGDVGDVLPNSPRAPC